MSEIEHHYISGFRCDKQGCGLRLQGEEIDVWDRNSTWKKRAIAAGWQCWVNRGVRHYCPSHGPSKVHQMRKAW